MLHKIGTESSFGKNVKYGQNKKIEICSLYLQQQNNRFLNSHFKNVIKLRTDSWRFWFPFCFPLFCIVYFIFWAYIKWIYELILFIKCSGKLFSGKRDFECLNQINVLTSFNYFISDYLSVRKNNQTIQEMLNIGYSKLCWS